MALFLKNLSFTILLLMTHQVFAQETNIPLFPDEDIYDETDHYSTPAQPQAKKVEIKEQEPVIQKKEQPNIGRNASMPEKIILTPPPLPEVSIDLTSEIPDLPPETKEPDRPISLTTPKGAIGTQQNTEQNSSDISNTQDVHDFEIEGFGLGMTMMDVGKLALAKGYKIGKVKKEFPLFLTTRYEQECRLKGLYLPEEIRTCMRQKGQEKGTNFVKSMVVIKPGTKEGYLFEFTSPGTGNLVWRITYTNLGDNSLNFNTVNTAKKLARQKIFFNAVYDTFGYPDDAHKMIWGNPNEAFMQVSMYGSAYNAKIVLTDVELSDEDYFDAKETIEDLPPMETFDFAL